LLKGESLAVVIAVDVVVVFIVSSVIRVVVVIVVWVVVGGVICIVVSLLVDFFLAPLDELDSSMFDAMVLMRSEGSSRQFVPSRSSFHAVPP
jgi:hypothetical protein